VILRLATGDPIFPAGEARAYDSKLYRRVGLPNLILCIDDQRQCADGDLPAGARVLRFRRHVAVEDVLRILRDAQ
jgi:hypothetical protein